MEALPTLEVETELDMRPVRIRIGGAWRSVDAIVNRWRRRHWSSMHLVHYIVRLDDDSHVTVALDEQRLTWHLVPDA